MSDKQLVERLRKISPVQPVGNDLRLVWEEAADAIERLEAENAEKDAALERWADVAEKAERGFADFNKLALKHRAELEADLAEARAEIERLRKILKRVQGGLDAGVEAGVIAAGTYDYVNEALAAPAPEPTNALVSCTRCGWNERQHEPIPEKCPHCGARTYRSLLAEPTTEREAERRGPHSGLQGCDHDWRRVLAPENGGWLCPKCDQFVTRAQYEALAAQQQATDAPK